MDTTVPVGPCPSGPLHNPVDVEAQAVDAGDRIWWPELGAWRDVLDVDHPTSTGRVRIVVRSLSDPPMSLDLWRWADETVTVEAPRQQREAAISCRWCGDDTVSATAVCASTACAETELRHRSTRTKAVPA